LRHVPSLSDDESLGLFRNPAPPLSGR
jgi:hypothetical protein